MSTTHGFTILHQSLHTSVYMVNVVIRPFQVRVVVMFFPRKFQFVWTVGLQQPYRMYTLTSTYLHVQVDMACAQASDPQQVCILW